MLNRRRPDDRDDELPTRDEVAEQLAADDGAAHAGAGDEVERLEPAAFLPPLRTALAAVVPTLLIVGVVLFLPYWGSEEGRALVVERGWLLVALGWVGMVVIITLGAALGLAISRVFSSGAKRYRRVDVLRLALGESFVAGAGALLVSVFVAGSVGDLLQVVAIVFVMTVLFTWARLFPVYRRAWDEASDEAGSSLSLD